MVSTPWPVTPGLLDELASRGVAALAETPPAPDDAGCVPSCSLARSGRHPGRRAVPVPAAHAARLELVRSGRLGPVSQARVSAAHGYHGVDLIRRFLGLDREPLTITRAPLRVADRGQPRSRRPAGRGTDRRSDQVIAFLDAGDRLGVYDFSADQYFSWVRGVRVLVRGERGELDDRTVRTLIDHRTPASAELVRHDTGQTATSRAITTRDHPRRHVALSEPIRSGPASDDEIAVATCLARMGEWLEGGPDVCSLADAAQDHHIGLAIEEAARTGRAITLPGHVWDESGRLTSVG